MGATNVSKQAELEQFFASALPGFLEYLARHSAQMRDLEVASSLDGIFSMPAYQVIEGVEKIVIAPLSLLAKDVDEQLDAAKKATDAAEAATLNANAAAARVEAAVSDVTDVKNLAVDAATNANNAAALCRSATSSSENATALCIAATNAATGQTDLCKSATDKAVTATSAANNAASSASSAAITANDAATAANSAATRVENAVTASDKATALCNSATNSCLTSTGLCNSATTEANNAASAAKIQGAYSKEQGDYAKAQGDIAKNSASAADNKVLEMDNLSKQVSANNMGAPVRLIIDGLNTISTKNAVKQNVGVKLLPSYYLQNILYKVVSGNSIDVNPSGEIEIKNVGLTKIWVIPTNNTSLWQERVIEVRGPLPLVSRGKFRISNGKIRIV